MNFFSSRPQKAEMTDIEQATYELRMMFRYASAAGLDIDQNTGLLIAAVMGGEQNLSDKETEALSHLLRQLRLSDALRSEFPNLESFSSATNRFSLVIAAHNGLAKLIAPATPISLQATEPAPGWLGSLRRPPLILAMIIIAVIAIIGFVVTSIISTEDRTKHANDKKTTISLPHNPTLIPARLATFIMIFDQDGAGLGASPNAPAWQKQLNWCFAAALGAVFYVLFKVHDYVKDRTFDPRYNAVYVVRFVLGILSGLILANVFSTPRFSNNDTVRSLGPAVAALLGGFSTEAVYQVLQRLVEIMLSAVRGDNSAAAKTQASDKARNELLTIASDPSTPPQTVAKLHAAAKKVSK
jgi:hypothetical protein